MFKLVLGVMSIIAGIVNVYYETSPISVCALLFVSGVYFTKLWKTESDLTNKNNRLGIITESNMPKISFQEKNIDAERREFLIERYDKARDDFLALQEKKNKTNDKALKIQLEKMEKIAGKLLSYLAENPEKISVASKFIDYYQDRALMLVNRYFELADTGLKTQEVSERRKKVMRAIFLMDEAYEAEFHKVLAADFMDIDAEINVIETNMKTAGITENNKQEQGSDTSTSNVIIPDLKGSTSERMAQLKRLKGYQNEPALVYDRNNVILNKVIHAALAIFLGSFGAHKFYVGKTALGIIYCALFWTLIPGLVGFVEGLRYLVMPVDDYYEEYCKKD